MSSKKISKTVMIDQFFDFYKKSVLEYVENTCVLMKVGGFWECYSIINETEKVGNAKQISEIIHCEFSNKNKVEKNKTGFSNRSYPDFFGFNTNSLSKYMPMLLNAGYTVVVVDQIGNIEKGKLAKREITTVCSPTLKLPEYEINGDSETNLVGVLMEFVQKTKFNKNVCLYSICNINNVTNKIELMEGSIEDNNLDEISRVLLRIGSIKELQINIIGNYSIEKLNNFFKEYTENLKINEIESDSDKYKNYIKPNFQNEYFKKVYNSVNFGLFSPLEYLDLSSRQLCTLNLMYIFDFVGRHDIRYLNNLTIPKIIQDDECLVLALNTLSQLNILKVFDTINFTNTAIGKRYLKSVLCKPFKDPITINKRYQITEELREINLLIDIKLKNIIDFERLHRKMSLESLRPYEFEKLNCVYHQIKEIVKDLSNLSIIPDLTDLDQYILDFKKVFDMNLLKSYNGVTVINFFNKGIIGDLDIIEEKLISMENEVENIRVSLDKIINETDLQQIKLDSSEAEGLFFTCTKIRFEKLKSKLPLEQIKSFKIKTNGNTVKFTNDTLVKLSFGLLNNRNLLIKKVNLNFQNKLKEYSFKYSKLFVVLKEFIELLDISCSNLKCSTKYNYTKPILIESDSSFVDCLDIRHPIIERISNTEYITNDIKLDNDNLGMLLYGLNSCGKSSLLRAIGVNLILAQCGLYTASSCFKFSPFNTLISQVDLTDNLFSGKSSFISEMSGLKKILNCCGKNTLVLSDELCKGSEFYSAQAIVSSTILKLLETNTKFFFTSHLHGIPNIECIKLQNKLQINHLSITIKENNIIFDRKLEKGSGPDIYGLEVAKNIIDDPDFINQAFKIRNDITGNQNTILKSKKSNYNKKKITSHCEICNYTPPNKNQIPLDTHHINEQKDADYNGFFENKSFHKNEKFNLVTLCKPCHKKIDTGELVVTGYKQSISGVFLDYTITS
jgi:DNA mismatch repair protein MutS